MKLVTSLFLSLLASSQAVILTMDNWDEQVAGKTVFIKFQAPWCGHCKAMKPAWDQLMDEYEDDPAKLIGDVDCTSDDAGELCDLHDVQGFPTIKWGDPNDLEDYEGGRDFDSLKEFAEEYVKPMCGVKNLDLCDADKKAEIQKLMDLPADKLDAMIEEAEKKIQDAEEKFEKGVDDLQDQYEKMETEKDAAIAEVKAAGLSVMKSIKATRGEGKDEL